MPAKSYRTYNLCIALHHIIARECVALSSSGGTKRKKEREKKLFLPIFIFSISEIGSGANPPIAPAGAGAGGVGVLVCLQYGPVFGNGTRELRTGPRSVLQYGTRIRDWVPLFPATIRTWEVVCSGRRVLVNAQIAAPASTWLPSGAVSGRSRRPPAAGGRGACCRWGPGRFRNGGRVFVRRPLDGSPGAKIKFKLGGTLQIFNPNLWRVR